MATIVKEGRVEAKGYPLTGGGVQKNSKKLNLQLTSDGLLSLLDSGKPEYSVQLSCYIEVNQDAKKKRLNITVDAETSFVVEPDDEVSAWLDAIAKNTPPKYFAAELSAITKEQTEVPQLIEAALQALDKHMDVDGIFRISGSKGDIEVLRKLYDTNQRPNNLLHYDVHTVTGLLKLFLRMLPTPLVPFTHYQTVLQLSNNPDIPGAFAALVPEFPPQSQLVLKTICVFMNRVGQHSAASQMTCSNLSIVVAPNLMRPAIESLETATHSQHIIPVFAAVFEHADKIFANVANETRSPANPRSRPVSMGFASPPSLPPVPSSFASAHGVPPPSLGAIPEGPAESAPSRRPVSMAVPGGMGSVMAAGAKLPPIPAGGAKKALRPTPPAPGATSASGTSSGTSPENTSSNPLVASGSVSGSAPQFQLPTLPPAHGAGAGALKKNPPALPPSGPPPSAGGPPPDGIATVSKSMSMSSLTKTPPAFGKRAAVVPLAAPDSPGGDLPPPSLPSPSTLTSSLPPAGERKDASATSSLTLAPPTSTTPEADDAAREAEAALWKSYENDEGRTYYHNESANLTQWEKPECLKKRVKKHRKGNSSTTSKEELMGGGSGAQKDSTPNPAVPAPAGAGATAPLGTAQPARATPNKRKTDRAQTTTAAPNMTAVNAIAATLPHTSGPPSLPPPVAASLPPAMPPSAPTAAPAPVPAPVISGPKSDAERINILEYKLAALEKTVADQAKLIEQLLESRP